MELIFLGTGTSHGIPMIGCDCPVCTSDDPRDRRFRSSAAVRLDDGRVILIDAPPELRLACIANRIERVDAILFTHAHADHIVGLDDVRRFNAILDDTIPAYANAPTLDILRRAFGYAEADWHAMTAERPALSFRVIEGTQTICGAPVTAIPLDHGGLTVLGFRIGGLAYCTDCSAIPPTSREMLSGLDLLVLDALRYTPHPTHFNFEAALEVVAALRPRRALLTHIAHEIPHADAQTKLPLGVTISHDGLRVQAAGP